MENYENAYKKRLLDIDALLAAKSPRVTAAIHLGGVAIECKLKALILIYHKISEWDELSGRPKDPKFQQPISRTSHALLSAVKLMDSIKKKAMADRDFITHLSIINNPVGATAIDFIALRYSSTDLDVKFMNEWKKSLNYVIGWLEKNESLL